MRGTVHIGGVALRAVAMAGGVGQAMTSQGPFLRGWALGRRLLIRRGQRHASGGAERPAYKFEELYTVNHQNLPRLPIPNLDDTLNKYVQSLNSLISPAELEKHMVSVERFRKVEGPKLQKTLIEEDSQHTGYPFSYIEKYWDDMYLELRMPISVHVNVGYSLREDADSLKPNSQAIRVSKFLLSTFKWQRKLTQGLCESEKGGPYCMSQLGRLLGTARIPTYGRDRLRFTPDSRHVIVMRHSQLFRVDIMSEDGTCVLPQAELQRQLQYILDTTLPGQVPETESVGILTMEDRNLWAHHREALKAESAANREALRSIQSALLMVCLDNHAPSDWNERSRMLLHGTHEQLDNRWFDKFQVIADPVGNVGINFEHSYADGVSWNRWLTEVWADMQGTKPPDDMAPLPRIPETVNLPSWSSFNLQDEFQEPEVIPHGTGPRKLKFDVPQSLHRHIMKTRERALILADRANTVMMIFDGYGKRACKKWQASPDGVVQMAFQCAFNKLHGKLPPTYESCATRSFFHGRTEVIRSAHVSAKRLAEIIYSSTHAPQEKAKALYEALKFQSKLSREASQGLGVDRHLLALKKISQGITPSSPPLAVPDDRNMPDMFKEGPYNYSQTWLLSTSNVSTPWNVIFNFGPVCDDGYGIGYLIHDDSIHMNLTDFKESPWTDSISMASEIRKALMEFSDVLNNPLVKNMT